MPLMCRAIQENVLYGLYAIRLLAGWAYEIHLVMAGLVSHEINSLSCSRDMEVLWSC